MRELTHAEIEKLFSETPANSPDYGPLKHLWMTSELEYFIVQLNETVKLKIRNNKVVWK